MKKKISLALIVGCLCVGCFFTGFKRAVSEGVVNTWKYAQGANFVPISYENVDDGTLGGIKFKHFVDTRTGCIWVLVEKYAAGYGISFEMVKDAKGEPLVLEGWEDYFS